MAYRLKYSDYSTTEGPPDPAAWVGPPGPMGPPGPVGPPGPTSPVSVKDFGAKGDGVTDDTGTIQAAVSAVPAAGGAVHVPTGRYLISAPIVIKSGTRLFGDGPGSVFLAAASWPGAYYPFVHNLTYDLPTAPGWAYTDHDITIENLTFDYGTLPLDQSMKCLTFIRAKNIVVRNCVFQVRGGANATAMIACDNTRVEGCRAYDFTNCAYDHWFGATRGVVVNCFATTGAAPQLVNWNPEGNFNGLTADTFLLADCVLECTNATSPASLQLEQLTSGNSNAVRNVTMLGNVLKNVILLLRGNTAQGQVMGNTFVNPLGTGETIRSYNLADLVHPANIAISNNIIVNPLTAAGSNGVIRIEADNYLITDNRIIGSGFSGCVCLHRQCSRYQVWQLRNHKSSGRHQLWIGRRCQRHRSVEPYRSLWGRLWPQCRNRRSNEPDR